MNYTRMLKEYDVGVFFINDNIDTRQNDGEFRLAIMASVAQEESRKISERVKWGQRRAMENGVVFGNNSIVGFDINDGVLSVSYTHLCLEKKHSILKCEELLEKYKELSIINEK